MIINKKSSAKINKNKNIIRISSKCLVVLSIVLFIGFIVAFFRLQNIRNYVYAKGYNSINPESISSVLKRTPWCFLKSYLNSADVDKISINLKFSDLKSLGEKKVLKFKLIVNLCSLPYFES